MTAIRNEVVLIRETRIVALEVLEILEYQRLHVQDISVVPSTESYLNLFMTKLHES